MEVIKSIKGNLESVLEKKMLTRRLDETNIKIK